MALFLDRHDPGPEPYTPDGLIQAHKLDLEVQEKHGVRYLSYWYDQESQLVFCLVDAPDKESAEAVHREAHGLVANQIIEVELPRLEQFLGAVQEADPNVLRAEKALRTILFTDIEGSTELTGRLGDEAAMRIVRTHDGIVRECLQAAGGRQVKHTGDGAMACFGSVVSSLECSIEIQRRLADHNTAADVPIHVRVGLSAGEPVTENDDLYGTAVQLASRICGVCDPGSILASSVVKDLSLGKKFEWEDGGAVPLRGFDDPVRLYRLQW